MGEVRAGTVGDVAVMIDAVAAQQRAVGAAQARQAGLMVQFAAVRRGLDRRRLAELASEGRRFATARASSR
jgi:hypothetical protein